MWTVLLRMNTPPKNYAEIARELVEGYCPPEATRGAYINVDMLIEDFTQALISARKDGIESAAIEADNWALHYPEDLWPNPKGQLHVSVECYSAESARNSSRQIATAIRGLLREGEL